MEIRVPMMRVRDGAVRPEYAHGPAEDAGLDLTYCGAEVVVLAPGERAALPTGIAIELPAGFEGQIRSRSGLALKKGIVVLNAPGTIDPSFRGEIVVILINLGNQDQKVMPGERIAQLVVGAYATPVLEDVAELGKTRRFDSGFGSTG